MPGIGRPVPARPGVLAVPASVQIFGLSIAAGTYHSARCAIEETDSLLRKRMKSAKRDSE